MQQRQRMALSVLYEDGKQTLIELPRLELLAFTETMELRMRENDHLFDEINEDDSWKTDQVPDVLDAARHNWKQVKKDTERFISLVAAEADDELLKEVAARILDASADTANYLAMLNWHIHQVLGPINPSMTETQRMTEEMMRDLEKKLRPLGFRPIFAGIDPTHSGLHMAQNIEDSKPFRGRLIFNQPKARLGPTGRPICPHCSRQGNPAPELEANLTQGQRREDSEHVSTIWHCNRCEERFDVREDYVVIRNTRVRTEPKEKTEKTEEGPLQEIEKRKISVLIAQVNGLITDLFRLRDKEKSLRSSIEEVQKTLAHQELRLEALETSHNALRMAHERSVQPEDLGIRFDKHPNGKMRIYREGEDLEWEYLTWVVDSKAGKAYYSFRPDESGAATFTDEEDLRQGLTLWHKMGRN